MTEAATNAVADCATGRNSGFIFATMTGLATAAPAVLEGCKSCCTVAAADIFARQDQRNACNNNDADAQYNTEQTGLDNHTQIDGTPQCKAEKRNKRMRGVTKIFTKIMIQIPQCEPDQKRQYRPEFYQCFA